MTPFSTYMAKMNEFGLGQFRAKSVLWRTALTFNDHEFGHYNATNHYLYLKIMKVPIPMSPNTLRSIQTQRLVLTASMCSALSYLLYGDKYWEKVYFSIYEETDNDWLLLPPDVLTSRYLFLIPQITLDTDPQDYHILVRIFPPEKETFLTYKVSIPEIKGMGKEIEKFIAVARL